MAAEGMDASLLSAALTSAAVAALEEGKAHHSAQQLAAALTSYDRAIALKPDFADAFVRRAAVLLKQRRHAEALASCTTAIALNRDDASAWAGLGRILGKRGQHELALTAYRRALRLDPDYPFLKGRLLQQMILSCDWAAMDRLIAAIEGDLVAGRPSARPFAWQAVSQSPASLRACAELFSAPAQPIAAQAPVRQSADPMGKLRIGYVSGEFRDHSTSYLRVGLFEHHDRDKFAITLFDNGWDDGGPTRARINQAVDGVIDISQMSDDDAAAAIAEAGIDILVDCNGFNGRHRMGVFARKPAPLQVTHPGYPGTLGTSHIDYILADATIIPPDHLAHYAEQVVHLPHSYQANDRRRLIADRPFSRTELGLPQQGIVFCCFNNVYKIMPATFDGWMSILRAVPGSILWLMADNPTAMANLRQQATARGVDRERLIFAERMAPADHLARHRLADLFLDTLPCNAHATASDALWSGLPLLTCLGTTFSGRVAASLLRAINLPELICETPADYIAKAIDLALRPAELMRIRRQLSDNRLTTPLFDTPHYSRHIEAAYRQMHQRRLDGLPPTYFSVAESAV